MTGAKETIENGTAVIGIELGSTRIKAVMADGAGTILAKGEFAWENHFVDSIWTHGLDEAWTGLQQCYAARTFSIATGTVLHASKITINIIYSEVSLEFFS